MKAPLTVSNMPLCKVFCVPARWITTLSVVVNRMIYSFPFRIIHGQNLSLQGYLHCIVQILFLGVHTRFRSRFISYEEVYYQGSCTKDKFCTSALLSSSKHLTRLPESCCYLYQNLQHVPYLNVSGLDFFCDPVCRRLWNYCLEILKPNVLKTSVVIFFIRFCII